MTCRAPNIIIKALLLPLLASGCATSRSKNLASIQVSDPESTSTSSGSMATARQLSSDGDAGEIEEANADTAESGDDEEEDLISNLDDAEFCKDNLYAQYLKQQYLTENPNAQNPEKAFKLGRSSRRRRVVTRSPYDQRDIEALYYARTRMVGETVPYFGAMPVVTNPRVEHWIRYFKNGGRKSFLKWLVRGESVRDLVVPILKEQGLPPEFIFLSLFGLWCSPHNYYMESVFTFFKQLHDNGGSTRM